MHLKRVTWASASAVVAGLSVLTAGAGVANAQTRPAAMRATGRVLPGSGGTLWARRPGRPWRPRWRSAGSPAPELAWPGIDQGRYDHQPFNYNGSWGFGTFGIWIPL